MIKSGDFLLNKIKKYFKEVQWNYKEETLDIHFAQLGSDAAIFGAAGLAMHSLEKNQLAPPGQ